MTTSQAAHSVKRRFEHGTTSPVRCHREHRVLQQLGAPARRRVARTTRPVPAAATPPRPPPPRPAPRRRRASAAGAPPEPPRSAPAGPTRAKPSPHPGATASCGPPWNRRERTPPKTSTYTPCRPCDGGSSSRTHHNNTTRLSDCQIYIAPTNPRRDTNPRHKTPPQRPLPVTKSPQPAKLRSDLCG